jgi:CheY-like chemotaxis protein
VAGRKTILLVEDNPDDEALVLHALRSAQVADDVAVVRDGAEALDYLAGRGSHAGHDPHDLPALMLMDLKLPKVDGFEVLREVRAAPGTRLLPVVVLTSSAEEEDLLLGYRLRANSYIRKPVDFTELLDVVGQIGRYWLRLNEAPLP